MILLENLPVPPSINESYKIITVPSRARGRMVSTLGATTTLQLYKNRLEGWFIRNMKSRQHDKRKLAKWVAADSWLEMRIVIYLPKEKMFFKNGKRRKWDTTRNKAVEDAVSKGLDFDDSWLARVTIEKRLGDTESCSVVIVKAFGIPKPSQM